MANLENLSTDERLILMGQATREAALELICQLTKKDKQFVAVLLSQAASCYMDKTEFELREIIKDERIENEKAYKFAFKPDQ